MANRPPRPTRTRQLSKKFQPTANAKGTRSSSPMIVDPDSHFITRAGRARIRYCLTGKNSLDNVLVTRIMGTSIAAVNKVLANKYNGTMDNIREDKTYVSDRFKEWVASTHQHLQNVHGTTCHGTGITTGKGSIKHTSDKVAETANCIESAKNSRKRKAELRDANDTDDANDVNTQPSTQPTHKRRCHSINSSSEVTITPAVEPTVTKPPVQPIKKLRKFFKRLGYQNDNHAPPVLPRLVQCGTTEATLLSMRGMLENRIASRLQTLNSLIEADDGKFTLAELELLAYRIASASDSDWSLLCDDN